MPSTTVSLIPHDAPRTLMVSMDDFVFHMNPQEVSVTTTVPHITQTTPSGFIRLEYPPLPDQYRIAGTFGQAGVWNPGGYEEFRKRFKPRLGAVRGRPIQLRLPFLMRRPVGVWINDLEISGAVSQSPYLTWFRIDAEVASSDVASALRRIPAGTPNIIQLPAGA